MTIAEKIAAIREGRQKDVPYHPELAGRVHLTSQQASEQVRPLDDYEDYARVYGSYTWVRKAIGRISEALKPLAVQVVDGDGEVVQGHPLSEVLAYANDEMGSPEMWERWVTHMMLAGEAFFEIVPDGRGEPVELWPRRPDEISVLPDESAERVLYPRAAGFRYGDSEVVIEPEAMFRSRFYNPLSVWRGLAPIAAVREGVTIDLFAQAWSKLFLKQGARPDYALITPEGLTSTEKEELETKLMLKFSGSENWHRPILLEQGVTDIKAFSFAPKDIEWLEQRKFSRDEVAAIFGVPDELMGYGRDTYENFWTAYRVFWLLTVKPLCDHRDVALQHHFSRVRPMLKPGERVQTDLTGVGVLQEDVAPKIESASQLWGMGVPFNTIDERLGLGIGEVPGGDVGYLPFSVMPVGQPIETGGNGRSVVRAITKAATPVYGSAEHVARWKAYDRRLQPYERRMQRQLKRDFQRQQNEALRRLREEEKAAEWSKELARAVVKGLVIQDQQIDVVTKREGVTITVDTLLDWEREIDLFYSTYEAYYRDTLGDFGQSMLEDLGVGISFDLQNPMVQDAIRSMAIKFARDINETTQKKMKAELREVLIEAEDEGWGIPQIQEQIYERISQVFNVRKSDYETERIARTEMVKASNQGSIDGMRQSGVVQRKGWLAAIDNRTRDTHIRAHEDYREEGIPIEAEFLVGNDRMLQPGGGSVAAENINCRCTVVAIL